jgi:hypothetical protein
MQRWTPAAIRSGRAPVRPSLSRRPPVPGLEPADLSGQRRDRLPASGRNTENLSTYYDDTVSSWEFEPSNRNCPIAMFENSDGQGYGEPLQGQQGDLSRRMNDRGSSVSCPWGGTR